MIWRLKHLSMVQCAFLIPEDVCSVIIFTGRDANQGACTHPCRWKYSVVEENVRENICRYMKMREELIFLIPKISV